MIYLQPANRLKQCLGTASSAKIPPDLNAANIHYAQQVQRMILRIQRVIPLKNKCLVYALAAKRLLNKKSIPSELFLGAKKINERWLMHAWLMCGPVAVTGQEESDGFSVIAKFVDSFKGAS